MTQAINIFSLNRRNVLVAIFMLSFCLLYNGSRAQSQYFQQEVNYKINVRLNDKTHELSAYEEIQYINNSNTSLPYIYFHLWPNAYKNHKSALAKQKLQQGETDFYYSKPEERGFIDSLDFKVNGESVKIEFDKENEDVCKLILASPLKSHDTILISTPFHVKLPDAKFSRLGHSGQAYYITQWYPKPAVFDNMGWHPMPYLNQGEFYSEFGSFDVSVTLPKNYLLAATGDRIDAEDEELWLNRKVQETEQLIMNNKLVSKKAEFPESSLETKTIRFMQSNVHDFAWFADKRFHVLKDQVRLPHTSRTVDTWVFFTDNEASLWKKSLEYIGDATLYYSYMIGDYPYNHVTAIDGVIAAGGGMEYPNITVIGESGNDFTLETTIMHEVGHNWFYGMLGTNERDFPAMDEGLNSLYEMRYIKAKYPEVTLASFIGKDSTFKLLGLNKFKHEESYRLAYLIAATRNSDQAIANEASAFTSYNYGAIVYSKTAVVFNYLLNSVGADRFDEAMRFYYENWKFKHPNSADLQNTLEYHCSIDMDWFIEGLIISNDKMDYKIMKHKQLESGAHEVWVKNVGEVKGPVVLTAYYKGRMVGHVWYGGFEGVKKMEFPVSDVDKFEIDGLNCMPEINAHNNTLRTNGLFKKIEPLQFNFIAKIDDSRRTQINYLPILGYNMYNKFMLGMAFYNYSLLQRKFEYTVAPMYAFGSNTPVGFADFQFNFHPKKVFQTISPGVKLKTFAYDFADKEKLFPNSGVSNPRFFAFNYVKAEPFIKFDFKKRNPLSKITQSLNLRSVITQIDEDHTYTTVFTTIQQSPYKKQVVNYVNELSYDFNCTRAINPFKFNLKFQQNSDFAKVGLTAHYYLTFKNEYSAEFRLFAGTFVAGNNKGPYRFRASGFNGYHDYMYDYNFIGRSEFDGLSFAQFADEDGAMKVWTPLGQSNTWLTSLNIKSPKFFKLPVKVFADVVLTDPNSLNTDKVLYCAGFEICLWKDIFEVYVPLVYSNDIKNTLKLNGRDSFFETLRFTLNINRIRPKDILFSNFM